MTKWISWLVCAAFAPALAQAQAAANEPPAVVTAKCAVCHGAGGETASEEFPRLAGQHEAYLAKELRDFRAGNRQSIMQRFAKGLTDEDIATVARYFAAQPAPPPAGKPSEIAAVGRYIFLKGNTFSGIPPCRVCHGEAAHGTAQLPRLAGQHVAYLERQVKEFSQRKRTNDNEVMHTVAEKLTALEVRAVAEFLAGLP